MKTFIFAARMLLITAIVMTLGEPLLAQVTIGSSNAPQKAALLDIKDQKGVAGGATSTTGGLLLPRVDIEKRTELFPFFDASLAGNSDYESIQKPAHKGLVVYNLTEKSSEALAIGIYVWDGEKWMALNAPTNTFGEFTIDCNSVEFQGNYKSGVALTSSEFMTVPVIVTKPGKYTIKGVPETSNGYEFETSGEFTTTGNFTIVVPASGTPTNPTPVASMGDIVKITINGLVSGCDKYLKIAGAAVPINPNIWMNCSSISVYGTYSVGTAMSNKNYIEVTLESNVESMGENFSLQTNTVDGIKFTATGAITSMSQVVRAYATGVVGGGSGNMNFILTNTCVTPTTCSFSITKAIKYRRMTVVGFGTSLYNISNNTGATGMRVLANNPLAFGSDPSSKVPVEGFTFIDGKYSNVASIVNAAAKPDILIFGHGFTLNKSDAQALKTYLENGGIVLAFLEDKLSNKYLMEAVFPGTTIYTQHAGPAGTLHGITSISDEITNGVFGDVRNMAWGEDASSTIALTGMPETQINIYSSNPCGATGFRHKSLGLVYFGDGGFNSYDRYKRTTAYPFVLDDQKMPKPYIGYGHKGNAYNSTMFANIFAWAIKRAHIQGINK